MGGANLKVFTDGNFTDDVLGNDLPVVVDFWAPWCGPCKTLTPIVEELAEEYEGKVVIGKIDVDSNPQSAARYGINSIPSLLFIKNGNVIDSHTGLLAKVALKIKIEKVFS